MYAAAAALLVGSGATELRAQELEGDRSFWELPLVAFDHELALGTGTSAELAGMPSDCLEQLAFASEAPEQDPASTSEAALPDAMDSEGAVALDPACQALLAFSPNLGGPVAAPSWFAQAWTWSTDHWMMLSAPIPLAFLSGGGGGGGGGGGASDGGSGESGGSSATSFGDEETPAMVGSEQGMVRTVAPVPEPSSWVLFGIGAAVVGLAVRKRARA